MDTEQAGPEKFRFLTDQTLAAGAADARIMPVHDIVVENRVRQKCLTGCYEYGRHLTCPPHAPDVVDFQKTLAEYRHAMIVKFRSEALFGEEIRYALFEQLISPSAKNEAKESAFTFVRAFQEEGNRLHLLMLELEKTAFNAGYPFAQTTVCGPGCRLCGECDIASGRCRRPTMKRHCPEGLGINLVKTTKNAGMPISFPAPLNPERIAILLIE